MRIPKYYSPSQANMFYSNREEYYRMYLADSRVERMMQTEPMAVGGAFDAHLKRALAVRYYGADDPRCSGEFDLEVMLDHCVDAGLDKARLARFGRELFGAYMKSGAYGRLCSELDLADPGSLLMEQTVWWNGEDGMVLMGKPDILFTIGGLLHVYDAKVNGFFSKTGASPLMGFVWRSEGGWPHKRAVLGRCSSGIMVDVSGGFHPEYCRQVSVYALACGGKGGAEFVAGIEQLACRGGGGAEIKVDRDGVGVGVVCASSRAVISWERQLEVKAEFDFMHRCIVSGYIFEGMVGTREESDVMCARLELECVGLGDIDSDFNLLVRR